MEQNKNFIAYYPILAELALVVYAVEYDINDRVLVGFTNEREKTWCNLIEDTENNKVMFWYDNQHWFLDEFIRIGL
jgi:hypothetical protein